MKESIKVENVMGGTISDVEIKMPEMLSMIEWVDSNKQELLLLNDLHGHGQGDCCLFGNISESWTTIRALEWKGSGSGNQQ